MGGNPTSRALREVASAAIAGQGLITIARCAPSVAKADGGDGAYGTAKAVPFHQSPLRPGRRGGDNSTWRHYPLPFFNSRFHPSTRALFPSASASGTIPFF